MGKKQVLLPLPQDTRWELVYHNVSTSYDLNHRSRLRQGVGTIESGTATGQFHQVIWMAIHGFDDVFRMVTNEDVLSDLASRALTKQPRLRHGASYNFESTYVESSVVVAYSGGLFHVSERLESEEASRNFGGDLIQYFSPCGLMTAFLRWMKTL